MITTLTLGQQEESCVPRDSTEADLHTVSYAINARTSRRLAEIISSSVVRIDATE